MFLMPRRYQPRLWRRERQGEYPGSNPGAPIGSCSAKPGERRQETPKNGGSRESFRPVSRRFGGRVRLQRRPKTLQNAFARRMAAFAVRN